MKSEAMKVGVVGVGRVGAACASAVALGFEKENAFAIIKALEKRWPAVAVVCGASMSDDFEGCLERGSTDHLGGRNRKSHSCAMAIPSWQSVDSADGNGVLSRSLRRRYIDILDASA